MKKQPFFLLKKKPNNKVKPRGLLAGGKPGTHFTADFIFPFLSASHVHEHRRVYAVYAQPGI